MSLLLMASIVWAGCFLTLAGLLIYRAVLIPHGNKQLLPDRIEAGVERDLFQRIHRIDRVDSLIRNFAIAAGILLLLIGVAWLHRGLYGPVILF